MSKCKCYGCATMRHPCEHDELVQRTRYHVVQNGDVLYTYHSEDDAFERAFRIDDCHVARDNYLTTINNRR